MRLHAVTLARAAIVLAGLLTPGCGIFSKDVIVDIVVGEGGTASLDVPQVRGQVQGPFEYHRRPADTPKAAP